MQIRSILRYTRLYWFQLVWFKFGPRLYSFLYFHYLIDHKNRALWQFVKNKNHASSVRAGEQHTPQLHQQPRLSNSKFPLDLWCAVKSSYTGSICKTFTRLNSCVIVNVTNPLIITREKRREQWRIALNGGFLSAWTARNFIDVWSRKRLTIHTSRSDFLIGNLIRRATPIFSINRRTLWWRIKTAIRQDDIEILMYSGLVLKIPIKLKIF